MNKLLILGTSLTSMEIVQAAKRRGWYTIVTDNQPLESSPVKQAADACWYISTADVDLLEQKCREENVNAVFSGVSEFNLDRVNEITRDLGLPCYIDDDAWKIARNKRFFKDKCIEKGIPVVPEYAVPDPHDERSWDSIVYPVVVKPVDGCGNAGISICNNREELLEGLKKARESSENPRLIIERYITGEDSWNYYFIADGHLQYTYSANSFVQPGYPTYLYSFATSVAEGVEEYLETMNPKCLELLEEIGCKEGMAWIQCIRDADGSYYALEMAHRMSADVSGKVLEECLGFNSIDWILDTALGVKHTADMLPQQIERPYIGACCVYFLFASHSGIIERMQGFDTIDPNRYHIETVRRVGDQVSQHKLMAKIAFYARNTEDMRQSLSYLNQTIVITDTDSQNLLLRFTDFETVERRLQGMIRE